MGFKFFWPVYLHTDIFRQDFKCQHVQIIGVGRFRILGGGGGGGRGGQGLEYWGGQGGAKFPAGT